jgi:hypothetical protein
MRLFCTLDIENPVIVIQDNYVILDGDITIILDLDTGKSSSIPRPGWSVMEPGATLGELLVSEATIRYFGDEEQASVATVTWMNPCLWEMRYNALTLKEWMFAECRHLMDENCDIQELVESLNDTPSSWLIDTEPRSVFISRVKPVVKRYKNDYYIFVRGFNRKIEVWTLPREHSGVPG